MGESCSICGCVLHRKGDYAQPTRMGRSHASAHHFVAERFFGRSKNRPGTQRDPIFDRCPWDLERQSAVYCYECHEELLHNPVFTPNDIAVFRALVVQKNLQESDKPDNRTKIGGRIKLLQEIIATGLQVIASQPPAEPPEAFDAGSRQS